MICITVANRGSNCAVGNTGKEELDRWVRRHQKKKKKKKTNLRFQKRK